MLRGRKAIEKYAEFQIKVGFKDAVFTTVEATKKDNTIYEVGNLTAKINPKEQAPFEEKLQYICVWKNTNSGWKAHRVIWNSAEPPPK
jgi:ketosteroid isomerase-like protein